MKILFITPTLPTKMSRIRAYNFLKCFSKNNEVYLLSFIDSEIKKKKIDEIRKYCVAVDTVFLPKWKSFFNCFLYLFSKIPLRVAYYKSNKMEERIKKLLAEEKFDIVYIKRKRMAQYGKMIKDIPKVLDLSDAVSLYYKRAAKYAESIFMKLFYMVEYPKLLKYEIEITRKFDKVIFCSSVDEEFIKENSRETLNNLCTIPSGVDTEYYRHSYLEIEENSILFSGIMKNFVNIDSAIYFCKDIFPLILKEIPCAKLYIVGPKPPLSIRGLSIFFRRKNGTVPVVVTGYVNDIREYIKKTSIVICPIRVGAGTRNKIYQAFSIGKPVVSTNLGAEGIDVTPDENILITDEPLEFAKNIIMLLKDKELQKKLGNNALKLISAKYSLDVVRERLDKLFVEIVHK